MSLNKQVRRIAIVGTGVIGASWAAQYLARGFDVIATNPDPKAESQLRKDIDAAWKELTIIGLSSGATRDRLTFTSNMKEALSNADFVQEKVFYKSFCCWLDITKFLYSRFTIWTYGYLIAIVIRKLSQGTCTRSNVVYG